MLAPRTRILFTTLAALGVSLAVSIAVVGGQQSSGRSDLTERATAFVRALKGNAPARGSVLGAETAEFLRPEDRSRPAVLQGIARMAEAFRTAGDDLEIAQVEILGGGKGRTFSPFSVAGLRRGGRGTVEARQIDWIRGADGRWYLDPEGL